MGHWVLKFWFISCGCQPEKIWWNFVIVQAFQDTCDWWNGIERGKLKHMEKNIFQCNCVLHEPSGD